MLDVVFLYSIYFFRKLLAKADIVSRLFRNDLLMFMP